MFRILGKSKIGFLLAILFGISLLFIKTGSRYSNFFNSDTVVAKVSETPISNLKFQRTMRMNIDKFNQMIGKQMTGDEIRAFQIHSLALSALINDAIFENEFDKINFLIDEKIIASKTKERIPQLYDENNNLNELYLKSFLQQQQLQIEDIVQIINFETRNEYFNNGLFNINFPRFFSNRINDFEKHERKISYIKIPLDQIEIDEKNLDAELNDYYNNNINNYMSKEKRDVEYLLIDKELLSLNLDPSDYEVKEYYNSNQEIFFQNEKRSFFQFNFQTLKEAEKFEASINNFNLDEILTFSKENNIRFNEFKDLESNEILDEISETLFNLITGEKSKIIETSLAKHILVLKSISPALQLDFKSVKDEISKNLLKIEKNNYYNNLLSEISNRILNGETLTAISKNYNLKKEIVSDLTRDFKEYEISDENFFVSLIEKSFSSNKDFVSNVININESKSYLFNVTRIDLSKNLNLIDIKDAVIFDLKNSKRIKKMTDNVKKNKDNINYIDNLTQNYNLDIAEEKINRNSKILPQIIINKIFSSGKNLNIYNYYNGDFYIALVEDIFILKNEDKSYNIPLNDNLRDSFGEELIKSKKISTNENLINAILAQY